MEKEPLCVLRAARRNKAGTRNARLQREDPRARTHHTEQGTPSPRRHRCPATDNRKGRQSTNARKVRKCKMPVSPVVFLSGGTRSCPQSEGHGPSADDEWTRPCATSLFRLVDLAVRRVYTRCRSACCAAWMHHGRNILSSPRPAINIKPPADAVYVLCACPTSIRRSLALFLRV